MDAMNNVMAQRIDGDGQCVEFPASGPAARAGPPAPCVQANTGRF